MLLNDLSFLLVLLLDVVLHVVVYGVCHDGSTPSFGRRTSGTRSTC